MDLIKEAQDALSDLRETMVLKSEFNAKRVDSIFQYLGIPEVNQETIGEKVLKSESVQAFKSGRAEMACVHLAPGEIKTAIIGAGTQNDALGNVIKPMLPANRNRLFIRDLMTPAPTKEAAVEYPTTTVTNNAAAQDRENSSFAESAATFDLTFEPVQTIAHTIPASKNILDDSPILNAFLGTQLLYDLRVTEEAQILTGITANSELNGILTGSNYTAYNRSSGSPDTDNAKQRARRAMTQIELSDLTCTGIVLHPSDWEAISLLMSIEPSTNNLFGVPVVSTTNIASGTFLAGDFSRGAALFDREDASITIAQHDSTNFRTGMITMRAMERVSLVIANPLGLVSGSF